jgi:hypothetical protein
MSRLAASIYEEQAPEVLDQIRAARRSYHIAEVKRHITRQRLRVEHSLDTGQRSELADSMLHAFEASLRAFEKHRKLVLNQLKRRLAPGSQHNRGRKAAGAEGDCRTTRTAILGSIALRRPAGCDRHHKTSKRDGAYIVEFRTAGYLSAARASPRGFGAVF